MELSVIEQLLAKYPEVKIGLEALGSLLIIAQVVVLVTPSKKDDDFINKAKNDSFFGKVWAFFVSFAPFQKGAKGLELSNTNLGKKE